MNMSQMKIIPRYLTRDGSRQITVEESDKTNTGKQEV